VTREKYASHKTNIEAMLDVGVDVDDASHKTNIVAMLDIVVDFSLIVTHWPTMHKTSKLMPNTITFRTARSLYSKTQKMDG